MIFAPEKQGLKRCGHYWDAVSGQQNELEQGCVPVLPRAIQPARQDLSTAVLTLVGPLALEGPPYVLSFLCMPVKCLPCCLPSIDISADTEQT